MLCLLVGGLLLANIGNSIWPIELARKVSSKASIDGIDITLEQCPPRDWLPANVHLIKHDVFEPFPAELVGKYDVVHVQLLICVIQDNNPGEVIRNLRSLLSKWTS